MRFRWYRKSSRAACVTMTVTRVAVQGMDVETALTLTLQKGHAIQPELISKKELRSLNRDVAAVLKRIEETRRCGTGASGKR
ncbi:hypothetical protein [Paenibacillus apiarius]|uniref:hypothetical protein n=1 Tax=Paenibacillus apiarius TaxID=46240 RepID=UPI003B3BCC75